MAKLLVTIGFDFYVAGIAMTETVAGAVTPVYAKIAVEQIADWRTVFVQIVVTAIDITIGPDDKFGGAAGNGL